MRNKLKSLKSLNPRLTKIAINEIVNNQEGYIPFLKNDIFQSIASRFYTQVKKNPSNISVISGDECLTYIELYSFSNAIATRIIELKANERSGIGLLFEPGIEMIAAMFGSLISTNYYVPLDPDYPFERLVYMVKDSGIKVLLTNEANYKFAIKLIKYANIEYVRVIDISEQINIQNDELEVNALEDDYAYILYTSGSTGKPKGVVQSQKNVLHFIKEYTNNLKINYNDRLTLLSSYCFDAAVMDIYGALLNGARLCIYNIKKEQDNKSFISWLYKQEITIYHSVPTIYRYLISHISEKEYISYVRMVVLGGEAVNFTDYENYQKNFSDNCFFINGLGPTESTVTLQNILMKGEVFSKQNIPVGYAVEDTEVILQNDNSIDSYLTIGEIIYKSEYLALGYLNMPELTYKVFTLEQDAKTRSFKTGDFGRRLLNGSIEFIGRKDSQVKINGVRIELQEIEYNLKKHPLIKDVIVTVINLHDASDKILVVYYISDTYIDNSNLISFLQRYLSDYMIPSYYIKLDQYPLTSTGKINRGALPLPDIHDRLKVGPENEIEKELADIYANILGVSDESICIKTSFFELGGNSLSTILLLSRIHKKFGVKLDFKKVTQDSRIETLAKIVEKENLTEFINILPIEKKEYYPLSFAQKRLYILQSMAPEKTYYNIHQISLIEGEIDIKKIELIFQKLINRHDIFRTCYKIVNDEIVHIIKENIDFTISFYEGDGSDDKVALLIKKFIKPFNLSKPPLIRVGLVKISSLKHILIMDIHHIISDGFSQQIILKDLANYYKKTNNLLPLLLQYRDYVSWQYSKKEKFLRDKQKDFWVKELVGELPMLDLPVDFDRPEIYNPDGAIEYFEFNEIISQKIKTIAFQQGVTTFMVLVSIFKIVLSKLCNQEEIIIGVPIAGRKHTDLENIIGLFANTLVLRSFPRRNLRFQEYLLQIKEISINAFDNQDFPFEELVDNLNLKRDTSRNPLFDVTFLMQNTDIGYKSNTNIVDSVIKPFEHTINNSKFDLSLVCIEKAKKISFSFQYCTRLFEQQSIFNIINYLKKVSDEIEKNLNKKIKDIEILSIEEKKRLLFGFNSTDMKFSEDKTIVDLFEEQVNLFPDKIALIINDYQLTYKEFHNKASHLATYLKSYNVCTDTFVGILAERSLEMIIGILGIIKAGAAYLPIDTKYPIERINYLLRDSETNVLLIASDLDTTKLHVKEIIDLRIPRPIKKIDNQISCNITPNNLAYLIYTSGSTGNPKGVMIEHGSVFNLISSQTKDFRINSSERIFQFSSISFDASVEQIFLAITNGATLVLVTQSILFNQVKVVEYINKNQVTHIHAVPSYFLSFDFSSCPSIKRVISGGDTCFTSFLIKYTHIDFWNEYGPTETTVTSIQYKSIIAKSKKIYNNVPIGKPIGNTKAFILDEDQNTVPINVYGQLYLSSKGLMRGYLNNIDQTGDKFVISPFNKKDLIYKTGDIAKWLPDGNISFLGRNDQQIKIRGFRIELDEIESHLIGYFSIESCVVIAKEQNKEKHLVAYYSSLEEIQATDLKDYLLQSLPDYMVPVHYVHLKEISLTSNGKIDRKALLNLEIELKSEYVAPSNLIEEKLVEIWSEVLGRDKKEIGIRSNFFELGGHSLKATILLSKIHKEFDVEVPIIEIFRKPIIQELSLIIEIISNISSGQEDSNLKKERIIL